MQFKAVGYLAGLCASLGGAGLLSGQDLAPASLENTVFEAVPTNSNFRLQLGNAAVLAGGLRTGFIVSRDTRSPGTSPYRWTKTGANTGTLTWSNGSVITTMEVTFTTSTKGTYLDTATDRTIAVPGDIFFSSIPQDPTPPLVNLSARTTLVAGQPAIVGFVVSGAESQRVLIRAVGPSLSLFGVAKPASNSTLAVFKGSTQLATNSGWGGDAALAAIFSSVGAFALPPGSHDAAVVLTLPPGDYTAQVGGEGGTEALLEVYLVAK